MIRIVFVLLFIIILNGQLYWQTSLRGRDFNKYNQYGNKEGVWRQLHQNGKVRYTGQFNNGVPHGIFKYYYDNGALKSEITYLDHDTTMFGSVKMFNNLNKLIADGFYRRMQKDSVWNYYKIVEHNSILVATDHYKNGKLNGRSAVFTPDGVLIQEVFWRDSILDGTWRDYYPNGQLKWEGNYIDGKLQGEVKAYHTNGKLQYKGQYNASFKTGRWEYYDQSDKFVRAITYRRSNIIKVEGEPIPEIKTDNVIDEGIIYEGYEHLIKRDN